MNTTTKLTLQELIRATNSAERVRPDLVRNVLVLTRAEILCALNTLCRRLRLRLKSMHVTEAEYNGGFAFGQTEMV